MNQNKWFWLSIRLFKVHSFAHQEFSDTFVNYCAQTSIKISSNCKKNMELLTFGAIVPLHYCNFQKLCGLLFLRSYFWILKSDIVLVNLLYIYFWHNFQLVRPIVVFVVFSSIPLYVLIHIYVYVFFSLFFIYFFFFFIAKVIAQRCDLIILKFGHQERPEPVG